MNGWDFNFFSFFRSINGIAWWQIAIELILIGIVVYTIVKFLEGTRGARMFKGIAMLLIALYLLVYIVGQSFKLWRIVFLYDKFLIFASVALAVAFQPELRRALMRLGETRLFRSWSDQMTQDISHLIEAATFLSLRKIGALIAIEREVGIGGTAENGTRVDAELSAELLDTIFFPNSPLHDLGVVVSNGRILYAAVQFPLAESGVLEKELGSRHRAAVGLSQESDAVVIVVSEETGDISVAVGGTLIRKLTPEGLRGLLTEQLGGRTDAPATERRKRPEAQGGNA